MGDVDLTKWIPQSTAKSLTGNNAPLEGPAPYYYNYSFGDIFSGNMSSAKAAAQQNVADYYEWVRNEASAERQREYELWLDNTRVQRTMQDLQAAGLNPWLAVTKCCIKKIHRKATEAVTTVPHQDDGYVRILAHTNLKQGTVQPLRLLYQASRDFYSLTGRVNICQL